MDAAGVKVGRQAPPHHHRLGPQQHVQLGEIANPCGVIRAMRLAAPAAGRGARSTQRPGDLLRRLQVAAHDGQRAFDP